MWRPGNREMLHDSPGREEGEAVTATQESGHGRLGQHGGRDVVRRAERGLTWKARMEGLPWWSSG